MVTPPVPDLILEGSLSSPSVSASWQEGILRMVGESYPENTYELFDQIISWIESYLDQANRPLRVELRLNYLNTSSIRAMIDIFDLLQSASESDSDVSVQWLYDSRNPRAAELGEEFKEDYTFPFLIQPAGI